MARYSPLPRAQYQLRLPKELKNEAAAVAECKRWSFNTFAVYAIEEQLRREKEKA